MIALRVLHANAQSTRLTLGMGNLTISVGIIDWNHQIGHVQRVLDVGLSMPQPYSD